MTKSVTPQEVFHELIKANGLFPNNPRFPLLIYKQMEVVKNQSPQKLQELLQQNHWGNSWVDSIYDYHHYHSRTHEVLVILAGEGTVQFGGDNGTIYPVSHGDVVIIPAGVAHKSLHLSSDFQCIGAYPGNVDFDMNYGKAEEHPRVIEQIKRVGVPQSDPIFGTHGLLFNYWK
ncbi:cupin domain-containing protein [Legionella sp. PC997]|uniref:cupin domain-containing protein n=1 Tax=Legionella sp. PC997 TaxID=2755562 RepID=UPI0015FD4799|nr:cupin domain-containing protein [Legionella sp. PC997]QMT61848.1 cupin domain-containing protein [Legionella sp. PC997]